MGAVYTGKNLIHYPQVNSTNSIAAELLSNTKPLTDGTVIMADEQTNGRGQTGNFWVSERAKNILLSIIYFPQFLPIENQFYLSMAISLGLHDFLSNYLDEVSIKWPNDLYVGNQKIAGILIENSLQQAILKSSIIGIGINVNQTQFSPDLKQATSFALLKKQNYQKAELQEMLFEKVEYWYEQLKSKKYVYIKESYLPKLFRINELADFECSSGLVKGKIIDIEQSGQLLVAIEGQIKAFNNKEIRFIL